MGPLDPSNRSLTVLMDGLGRLEYRGYDSAGVALLTGTDPVEGVTLVKVAGKLAGLRAALDADPPAPPTARNGPPPWAPHRGPRPRRPYWAPHPPV